jgi:hypothetical protein
MPLGTIETACHFLLAAIAYSRMLIAELDIFVISI